MEDLTKTQLILLTLLVSFVTSIATGIMTVSLLQEAPQSVTQTINRVVERTIEKVVPTNISSEPTTKETVIVKEEDLVIDAINKNIKSILRIKDSALVDGVSQFYGLGFLVTKDGIVISDRRENVSSDTTYVGTFSDGTAVQMKVKAVDENSGIVYMQILTEPNKNLPGQPATFASKELQLGQSVIALEGQDKTVVSTGRVVSLDFGGADPKSGTPALIQTDIAPKTQAFGGPIVNLSGEIVGIRTSKGSSSGVNESYTSLSVLKASMGNYIKK